MNLLDVARGIRRRLEVDEMTDLKLRRKFSEKHNVDVGLHSYGCFDPARIDPYTQIGRYCSFALTARIMNRNHGLSFMGLTPYLYNSRLKVVDEDTIDYIPCQVEDDVWVGHNAVITPSVRHIGRGAAIAACAVVTRDVPAYAVMIGMPAVPVRMRFTPDVMERIEATRWWEEEPAELRKRVLEDPDFVFRPAEHLDGKGA